MKRFICIFLAIVMLFSIGAPALAADDGKFHYVAFGASNTNGYGLRYCFDPRLYAYSGTQAEKEAFAEYGLEAPVWNPAIARNMIPISGYGNVPEGSYPDLVRQYFTAQGRDVVVHPMAMNGMREAELRVLLDDTFDGDIYTQKRFYDPKNPDDPSKFFPQNGGITNLRAEHKEAVENADFITYDMGINEFGAYFSYAIGGDSKMSDFAYIYGEKAAQKFYSMRQEFESRVLPLLGGVITEDTAAQLDNVIDTVAYALLGYCHNFDINMGIIRRLNPDVPIVVATIQSTMYDLEGSIKGIRLPIGRILTIAIDMANAYMMSMSPYKEEYYMADVSANGRVRYFTDDLSLYNGDPATIPQEMKDCFDVYDNSIYLKSKVTAALEGYGILPGDPIYDKVLSAAYDAAIRICKAAVSCNPMPLDGLLAGDDLGKVQDQLMDGMKEVILQAAMAELDKILSLAAPDAANELVMDALTEENALSEGEQPVDDAETADGEIILSSVVEEELVMDAASPAEFDLNAVIDELLSGDTAKMAACFGVRTSIGNSFFAHPTREGHQYIYTQIMNAYNKKITSEKAFVKGIDNLKNRMLELGMTYGVDASLKLAAKLFGLFKMDKLFETVVSFTSVEEITDYILDKLDLRSDMKILMVGQCIDEIERDYSAHHHKLIRIPAVKATVLTPGRIAHYYCPSCGKCFSDAKGEHEISYASTFTPVAKSSLLSAFLNLFRR